MLFIFETCELAVPLLNRTDKPQHGDDNKDQIKVIMAETPADLIERTLVHIRDLQDQITQDGMVENINRQDGTRCDLTIFYSSDTTVAFLLNLLHCRNYG